MKWVIFLIWIIGVILMLWIMIHNNRRWGITLKQLTAMIFLSLTSWILFVVWVISKCSAWISDHWNEDIIK